MGRDLLTGAALDRLQQAPLTYAEVGHSLFAELPRGYHHLRRQTMLGFGSVQFEAAAKALLGWEMHRRAGVEVVPSTASVKAGAVAVLRLGRRLPVINAPVRVVSTIGESRRAGFCYGTLQGHPESGEEAFVVEILENGEVVFTISAFSRPSSLATLIVDPIARMLQKQVTNRYLRALHT